MKILGNQPIFYLWPIQKLLHLGIPNRVQSNIQLHELGKCKLDTHSYLESWRYMYLTLRAIPTIYGGNALYMVVLQRQADFLGNPLSAFTKGPSICFRQQGKQGKTHGNSIFIRFPKHCNTLRFVSKKYHKRELAPFFF